MRKSNNAMVMRAARLLLCLCLCLCLPLTGAFAGAVDYKIYHVEKAGIADNIGYYFVDEGNETYPLYCHDEGYHEPPLNKISAGRTDYLDAVGMTYARGQTTEGYLLNELTEALQKKALAVLYAGYPNDGTGLAAKYPTTPERYQIATQNALWGILGGYASVADFNDANMGAYFQAVRDYALDGGGYGGGAPGLPADMRLAESGGAFKTAVLTIDSAFGGQITLSLPTGVRARNAATDADIAGALRAGDRFYLEYTGTNAAAYSGSVGYAYQAYDASYLYTTDETIDGGAVQRMVRLQTRARTGTLALSGAPVAQTGSLTISKSTAGTGVPDAAAAFAFTVTDGAGRAAQGTYQIGGGAPLDIPANGQLAIRAGETAVLSGLAAGEYRVTEAAQTAANYQSTAYQIGTGSPAAGLAATLSVPAGGTAAVAFANTYALPVPATGNLTVTKAVAGNAADSAKAFAFTVTLDNAAIDGLYGDMTFAKGVAAFTLKHGERKAATGLPQGCGYTVAEADYAAEGYIATHTGASGTISAATAALAAFVNTRSIDQDPVQKTRLSVQKVWVDTSSQQRPARVTVQLYRDGAAFGEAVALTAQNGWQHVWTDLDAQYAWTVDEPNVPAGYAKSVTHSGAAYTITNTAASIIIPRTGDKAPLGLYVALLCLSLLALRAALRPGRKTPRSGKSR